MSFRKQLAHCSRAERISITKISNFQPLQPMKKIFLWGILQGIPYNKLTSIGNKNQHRSHTKLLAYWQELSNPTVPNLSPSTSYQTMKIRKIGAKSRQIETKRRKMVKKCMKIASVPNFSPKYPKFRTK